MSTTWSDIAGAERRGEREGIGAAEADQSIQAALPSTTLPPALPTTAWPNSLVRLRFAVPALFVVAIRPRRRRSARSW